MRAFFLLAWMLSALVSPLMALAETAEEPALRVGVRVAPPFVIEEDGRYRGIAVELWEQIAEQQGWTYQYRSLGLTELLAATAAGEIDVAVGALTVTSQREQVLDFSQPFHSGGLGIAVSAQDEAGLWALARRLFSPKLYGWIAALALLLGTVGVFAWLLERRANPDQFGGTPLEGMGSGFWWAAVTMSTVGYGDKAPISLGGRLLALVWMFAAIILLTTFTAGITASLTIGALSGRVQGADDLPRARVASIAGSTAADWLIEREIASLQADDAAIALQWLAEGRVDAVVYDAPILQFLVQRDHPARLAVLGERIERQNYAFALAPGQRDHAEAINRGLLERIESADWRQRLRRYLGDAN